MKKEQLLDIARGEFLDPKHVGSSVRYAICATKHSYRDSKKEQDVQYVDAEMNISLSDCTRVIGWGKEYDDRDASSFIKKLDVAIRVLQEARQHALSAQALMKQFPRARDSDEFP